MKKVVLLLMMCLSGLLASAATYNVKINDANFVISAEYPNVDITSQIGDLLQVGDKVIVTVEGYFDYNVNVRLLTIADNSEEANWYKMLTEWNGVELGTATVGEKFSESYEFTITEDAVTTDKYIVQISLGFNSILEEKQCQENGGIVTLSHLAPGATAYNVLINDFDFDCSSDNDIDISSQIGELLKIGDEVNVTVEGYFSAKVTGVGICGIVDGSEAASWWTPLTEMDYALSTVIGSSTEVGEKFSASYVFEIIEDAESSEVYKLRLCPKVPIQAGDNVTLRPTDEPDPEGETYTINIISTVFSDDGNGSNYMAQFPFVTESTTLKKNDKVVVTFDGSFSQDMNGINFMIFDGNWNEVLGWTAKSLFVSTNENIVTSYEFNIKNNYETDNYYVAVFVEGYDENVELKFTKTGDINNEYEYLGGPSSVYGSFYTANNGVQTKVQLGEDGSQVLFCLGSDDKGYYFVSGTKTANEIVNSTAAETRFSVSSENGDDNDFNYASNKVYVMIGGVYGFKNKNAQGTVTVVDIDEETDDVTVKVEKATGSGEDFSDKLVYLGGPMSSLGSFFTADNGVQTKSQLGDDASKVVFCFSSYDGNVIMSGTVSPNEIVSTQASETKFVAMSEASMSAFKALIETDFTETSVAVIEGSVFAFKNEYATGFFKVGNIDGDLQMKLYMETKFDQPGDYEYLGGPSSVYGSFYTANNGVQTKVQLGEDGSQVLFCLGFNDGSYSIMSGTESANEIVKSQALETRFDIIGDLEVLNYLTPMDYRFTRLAIEEGGLYAFINKQVKGYFSVVEIQENTQTVVIDAHVEEISGEVFPNKQALLGGASSMYGSFYTADKGVQTKAQLGDDASQVLFAMLMGSEGNCTAMSGTLSANEIVKSQASETKFALMRATGLSGYSLLSPSDFTQTSVSLDGGANGYAFSNKNASGFFTVNYIDLETETISLFVYLETNVVKTFETSYAEWDGTVDIDNDGISDQWENDFDEFTTAAGYEEGTEWQPATDDKFTLKMSGMANFTGYVQLHMADVREEVGWFKEFSTAPERIYVKEGERFEVEREFVVKTITTGNIEMLTPKLHMVCIGQPTSSQDGFDNTVKKTLSLTKYEMKYVPFVQELVATWDSYTGNDTDLDGISDLWNGNKYVFEHYNNVGDSYEFQMSGFSTFTGTVKFWMINWGVNGQTWNEIAKPSPLFNVTAGEEYNFTWTFDVTEDEWVVGNGAASALHYQFMPSTTSTKEDFDNSVEMKLFVNRYSQTYIPVESVQAEYLYIYNVYSDTLKIYLPKSTVLSSTYGSPITYEIVSSNTSVPAYISNDTLYVKSIEDDRSKSIEIKLKGTIENGSSETGTIAVFAQDEYWEWKSVRANDTLALYVPNEYIFSNMNGTGFPTRYRMSYDETDIPVAFSNDTLYVTPSKEHFDKSVEVIIKGYYSNGSILGEKLHIYIEHDSIVPNPEIALVTVSQTTGKNLVVWQKFDTDKIDHYNIYREGEVAGKYEKIAEVPYSETSVYEDLEADPVVQPWRYGITATPIDNNYGETEMSSMHKTLHLQQNQGLGGVINLSWNEYKGIDYSTYKIIRKSVVRNVETIDTIATIPSNLTTYTDIKPAKGTQAYYVAIELPQTIDPNVLLKSENGPFSLAISNIAEVEIDPTAVSEVQDDNVEIRVTGRVITILNAENGVKVYDVSGRLVAASDVAPVQQVEVAKAGVYFVKIGDNVFKVVLN